MIILKISEIDNKLVNSVWIVGVRLVSRKRGNGIDLGDGIDTIDERGSRICSWYGKRQRLKIRQRYEVNVCGYLRMS